MTMLVLEGGGAPLRRTGDTLPVMDDAQFQRWAALLDARAGLCMPPARKSFLVTSVALRMRELGFADYDSYYRYLTSGVMGNVEWTSLIDRLTVHETRFFRDPGALQVLARQVLPGVVESPGWDGNLNVWSVGCSTGEEVYTLAMVLEHFVSASSEKIRYGVTGTDISLQSMSVGRAGVYSLRRSSQIPDAFHAAYCEDAGVGYLRVKAALRRRVAFAQMNILDIGLAAPRQMDVIYCQNVLIYFARSRRLEILDGLVRHLRPGGAMILGAGEMINWKNPLIERIATSNGVLAYRRQS